MKQFIFSLVFFAFVLPCAAADWPREFIAFEQAALHESRSDFALQQLIFYGVASGRRDEIEEWWKSAAADREGDRYSVLLGRLAIEGRDFAAAESHFRKAIKAEARDAAAWEGLGHSLPPRPDRQEEAQTAVEKALDLALAQGEGGLIAVALAQLHLARGKSAEAVAVLERALAGVRDAEEWRRLARHWAGTMHRLGRLPAELTRLKAAMQQATIAWDFGPNHRSLKDRIADVNLGWRTYDRAGKQLGEQALRTHPIGKRFWHFQGQRLRRQGDEEGAPSAPNAVWLEPIIKDGRGGFDLAGLSLIEIPPAPQPQ